jgi:hypothetical protein
MKCTVQMASSGMICIRSFMEIGSGVNNLLRRGYIHWQQSDLISLLLFLKTRYVFY